MERVPVTLATMPGTSRLAAASPASDASLKDQLASLEDATPTKGTARKLSGEPDVSAMLQQLGWLVCVAGSSHGTLGALSAIV